MTLGDVTTSERRAVAADIDKYTIAALCFGSYFAAFCRGDSKKTAVEINGLHVRERRTGGTIPARRKTERNRKAAVGPLGSKYCLPMQGA
jgi:hypothetical protein